MLKAARLLRPFLSLPTPNFQCRRVLLAQHSRRNLKTSRPLCATLATSATAFKSAGSLPASVSELLLVPSQQAIEDSELDIELLSPDEARIQLTEQAAEQLRYISTRENNPDVALRICVESGGCHGYQYKMDLTADRQPDDYLLSHPSLKPSNILIDAVSMPLLKGSTLDFATELIGSSFRITDNPQATTKGCGCGVSWELKV